MKIQLDNIYYTLLAFGPQQIEIVVAALSPEDAIKTLNDYYDEPNILCLVSAKEMIVFLEELQTKPNGTVFVLELNINESNVVLISHEETGLTEIELKEKYKSRQCNVFTKELLEELIKRFLNDFSNTKETMIMSDVFDN